MPAFSEEMPVERAPVIVDVPLRDGFRCPYDDSDQHLLASSPPGYELWRKAGSSDRHTSYGSSCQTFNHLSSSSNGKNEQNKCISTQQTHDSSLEEIDTLSLLVSENLDLDSNKTEAVNSTHRHEQGRVKKVSFADEFGYRLTEVKYFSNYLAVRTGRVEAPVLLPDFSMPLSAHSVFAEKVDRLGVSLESLRLSTAAAAAAERTLVGSVRVRNLAFDKRVFARWSFDAWKTSTDIGCDHRPALYPGEIAESQDRFTFALTVPQDFSSGSAEFAVCFQCDGKEYWDNNGGANYRLISPNNRRAPDLDDSKSIS